MALNSWPGLAAVLLGILCFYVTTYAVIALNVGWRFAYWLSSATFGATLAMLSIFWLILPVGPQGAAARWIIQASAPDRIDQVAYFDQTLSTPSQYPAGGWQTPALGNKENPSSQEARAEAFGSGVANCLTATDLSSFAEIEHDVCEHAQELMPDAADIPVINGVAVSVQPELDDIRFIEEDGTLIAQARVTAITHDPRVADDPEAGQAMGESFLMLAVFDSGTFRLPALMSLLIFLIYTGIHLLGLQRAEERKLSPVA